MSGSDALTVHRVDAGAMAGRAVAVISDWLDDGGTPAGTAVLTRVNSALLPIQVALHTAGVPATAPLDASVLRRTGIRSALAWMRIGLDPERIRRDDVFETLRRPSRKLIGAMTPLLKRQPRWSLTRLHALEDLLGAKQADRLAEYLADIQHLTDRITAGADTGDVLEIIRNHIGLGEAMDTLDSSRTRPEGSSHGDDLDALEQLAALHPTPVTFREWLVDALNHDGDPDGVVLSTVHRVKGMEWDRVVVFAANAGLLPHRLSDDDEEERRVFHVALTRCRERVAVVANRAAASPFIAELFEAAQEADRTDLTGASRVLPAPADPARDAEGNVIAAPGVDLTLPGGFAGRILDVDRGRVRVALLEHADVVVEVNVGDRLQVDGAAATLLAPRRRQRQQGLLPDAGPTGVDDELFEALRSWRARVAAHRGMPAYIVLHDSHLMEIAERRPTTLRALGRCRGIGATKLEQYGDDILEIVANHVTGD